jgi:hypothetical protein
MVLAALSKRGPRQGQASPYRIDLLVEGIARSSKHNRFSRGL